MRWYPPKALIVSNAARGGRACGDHSSELAAPRGCPGPHEGNQPGPTAHCDRPLQLVTHSFQGRVTDPFRPTIGLPGRMPPFHQTGSADGALCSATQVRFSFEAPRRTPPTTSSIAGDVYWCRLAQRAMYDRHPRARMPSQKPNEGLRPARPHGARSLKPIGADRFTRCSRCCDRPGHGYNSRPASMGSSNTEGKTCAR